jgi:hypothetical protein
MSRTFTYTTEVFDEYTDFPQTGDVDTIYIDASKNKAYRYDQSYYAISSEGVDIWGAIGSLSKGGGGGGGASWGSINGTLSNQTDLNTALSAKQDTLTLTTTGTSGAATLVGDTLNIPQYSGGGGGLQGAQIQMGNNAGQPSFGFNAQLVAANGGTGIPTASRLDVYPLTPNKTLTNVSLTINVSTLGAGALARLLVYSDVNGYPSLKLFESASIDCSTTGDKTVLTGLTFTAGTTYWLGFYSNAIATFRTITASSMLPIFSASATTTAVAWSRINTALGTAPSTFNYNTYSSANQINIIVKQV